MLHDINCSIELYKQQITLTALLEYMDVWLGLTLSNQNATSAFMPLYTV